MKVQSALELDGASICVAQGSTTELNLADYFRAHNLKYEGVAFKSNDETVQAYAAGRCDAYTTDASGLASFRLNLPNPDEHLILPEIISKEPLAFAVRKGDSQWATIVRWVHFLMVDAEEAGVDFQECRRHDEIGEPRGEADAGRRGEVRRGAGPFQHLGSQRPEADRQLRRRSMSAISAPCRR